ncbi:hypothetical protein CDL12_05034 [Handroanthus impetiginosus]|uniref:Uncharacterized protein n=1 Tax=Handroanthus impetiginosus TaxID=429701 RepID=A0A2G9HXL6_9LAMI|nr:hypothetical protein CDL12_05034 [Handroanthus impetiginosus]
MDFQNSSPLGSTPLSPHCLKSSAVSKRNLCVSTFKLSAAAPTPSKRKEKRRPRGEQEVFLRFGI